MSKADDETMAYPCPLDGCDEVRPTLATIDAHIENTHGYREARMHRFFLATAITQRNHD